jgi:ParB-like chromosome segregation protein Spo0J
MIVTRVPLASLHVDPGNVRVHGEENMQAIKDSLGHFAQVEPLVVQRSTGRVIGGNGRLAAMRDLGWTECDVVEIDIDDRQATALGIALNRTSELATWNEPELAKILAQLRTEDALDGVGYSSSEIDDLLASFGGAEEPVEDEGPGEPPVDPVSRTGDLWLLGDHKLLCGDSTKESL